MYYRLFLLHLLLSLEIRYTSQQHVFDVDRYPWGSNSYENHQENLLISMRKNLYVDIKNDVLSQHLKEYIQNGNQISVNNRQNKPYVINLKSSENEYESNKGYTNEKLLNIKLQDYCGYHQGDAYWNFEYCHRKEVRQVHFEYQHDKLIRSPDWSLGLYDKSRVIREGNDNANSSAVITHVS
jgi:hypothetical protein